MKQFATEIRWAFIFVATLLLWMVAERAVGLHSTHIDKHMIYTNLFAIPAIVVYVLALRDKRQRDHGGIMTYRQGVRAGLIITAVVALLSAPAQWVISTLITPDYFANVIAYSVDTGAYDSYEAAAAYFNLGNYLVQSVVGALIMGTVTSLIVAFFTRSKLHHLS